MAKKQSENEIEYSGGNMDTVINIRVKSGSMQETKKAFNEIFNKITGDKDED